jgi:hypothetical protein
VQWANGGSSTVVVFSPKPLGTDTYYTVLWESGQPNHLRFQIDGQTVQTATAAFVPDAGYSYGITTTLANQMPGGTSTHERFYDTHIYYSGSWRNMNGAVFNPGTSYFGTLKVNTLTLEIWDKACST